MVLIRASAAAAAMALLIGCVPEVEDLEGRIYEVCYRGLPVQVERVSADSAHATLRIDEVDFDAADLDDPRVGLHTIAIAPGAGIDDFEFVDAAYVDVQDARIMDLPAARTSLYGETDAPPNLMPYARGGDIDLTLVFEGDVPRATWRVTIDACFSVEGVSVSL